MATKPNAKKVKLPATWEEVCKLQKLDPVGCLPVVSGMPEQFKKQLMATAKLYIITECLNIVDGGKPFEPNWDDYSEYKYFPWFYMNNPGFRFYVSLGYYYVAFVGSGARLCFRTRALSDFAGKTFEDVYRDAMIF